MKMLKEPMYRDVYHCIKYVHAYFFKFICKIYHSLKKKAIQMCKYMYEEVIA